MWTSVYISKDEKDVSLLKQALGGNDILAMVRKRGDYFEILVPSREIAAAHNVIIDTEI